MKIRLFLTVLMLGFSGLAAAQATRVEGPWARVPSQGQTQAGAFMRLTSLLGAQLVGASSPVAQAVTINDMRTERGAMARRTVPSIELPAGRPVDLNQCGPHLLMTGLKQPLTKGMTVPLTLVLKDRNGNESRVAVQVPVTGGAAASSAMNGEGSTVGVAVAGSPCTPAA